MNKQLVIISTILLFFSCVQTKKEKTLEADNSTQLDSRINNSTLEKESFRKLTNLRKETLSQEFETFKIYSLNETLIDEFNGDGFADKAEIVRLNGKSGIIITDGKSKELTKLGFGKNLAHLTDFDWVNYWGVVKDSTTYEVQFDSESGDITGSKTVRLKNISIFLRRDDNENGGGGGIITYIDNEYKWIHQAD